MMLALKMVLCVADMGYAAYPGNLNRAWLGLLWEEFYNQTDHEIRMGMELTLQYSRSSKSSVHRSYAVFTRQIAMPMFEAWGEYASSSDYNL
jgi:hypothetical protein